MKYQVVTDIGILETNERSFALAFEILAEKLGPLDAWHNKKLWRPALSPLLEWRWIGV